MSVHAYEDIAAILENKPRKTIDQWLVEAGLDSEGILAGIKKFYADKRIETPFLRQRSKRADQAQLSMTTIDQFGIPIQPQNLSGVDYRYDVLNDGTPVTVDEGRYLPFRESDQVNLAVRAVSVRFLLDDLMTQPYGRAIGPSGPEAQFRLVGRGYRAFGHQYPIGHQNRS